MSAIAIANIAVVCWNLLAIMVMHIVGMSLMGSNQKTFDYGLESVVVVWIIGIPIVWLWVYHSA